jgi:hypothetical protein
MICFVHGVCVCRTNCTTRLNSNRRRLSLWLCIFSPLTLLIFFVNLLACRTSIKYCVQETCEKSPTFDLTIWLIGWCVRANDTICAYTLAGNYDGETTTLKNFKSNAQEFVLNCTLPLCVCRLVVVQCCSRTSPVRTTTSDVKSVDLNSRTQ